MEPPNFKMTTLAKKPARAAPKRILMDRPRLANMKVLFLNRFSVAFKMSFKPEEIKHKIILFATTRKS